MLFLETKLKRDSKIYFGTLQAATVHVRKKHVWGLSCDLIDVYPLKSLEWYQWCNPRVGLAA